MILDAITTVHYEAHYRGHKEPGLTGDSRDEVFNSIHQLSRMHKEGGTYDDHWVQYVNDLIIYRVISILEEI